MTTFYDSFAKRKKTKLGSFFVEKTFEKLSKIVAEFSPVKVLEIGVGNGILYEHLKMQIPSIEYIGIEPSNALYEKAKSKNINAIKCFVPPFPQVLEKGSFDMVIISHVLEHFRDYREILDVFGGINDLLKQNRKLLLFHPCALDWGKDFYDCDYSHSYFTTKNRTENLLLDSGFRIIKQDSYRACFNNLKLFFYIISKLVNCFAFFSIKMRITFKKNLLTVAEKI
ncbi:MAG: class I SAM-dependent methyltransferase [Fibromonadaceae bacterium]|jgi:SAM-dependent methyltransferase|nr:class I SAM-dependent methyltransferase [Fibromonadaceae bacterium]